MTIVDQMHRVIHPPPSPQRIVSLVPSQTELLAYLGLEDEVVGITKFCVHPARWFRSKTRVGGTKQLKLDVIDQLQPDLIIANKEENERSQIEALARRYPVWLSDIATLPQALDMVERVGELVGRATQARALVAHIDEAFATLPAGRPPLAAAYLIWRDPYMVAAGGTFIDDMLSRAGFVNAFADQLRYPEVSAATLAGRQPQAVLLSSEPYPFGEKHLAELRALCPQAVVELVDGEAFSWYGSRLLDAPVYFYTLYRQVAAQLQLL